MGRYRASPTSAGAAACGLGFVTPHSGGFRASSRAALRPPREVLATGPERALSEARRDKPMRRTGAAWTTGSGRIPAMRGPEPRNAAGGAPRGVARLCRFSQKRKVCAAPQALTSGANCVHLFARRGVGCAFRRSAPLACCEGQMDQASGAIAPRERNMLSNERTDKIGRCSHPNESSA